MNTTTSLLLFVLALSSVCSASGVIQRSEEAVSHDAQRRFARTTPFQAAILADGVVDFDEYMRSTHAVIRCLRRIRRVNLSVSDPVPAPGNELEFTVELAASPVTDRMEHVARHAFDRCQRVFASDVQSVYANQLVVPDFERPVELARLMACLRGAGVTAPRPATMAALQTLLDANDSPAVDDCVRAHWNFFRRPMMLQDATASAR